MPKLTGKKPLQSILTTPNAKASGLRVRSASTGRDKRSELQARYWALLFDNLKRAINEIYQTVECHENISSCQEAILVLDNYVRDFKALAEWFRLSGDYEAMPQRQLSLTWEVRKSNPTTPRLRAKSLSSPSPPVLSGKSSPCPSYSGKSSPCLTIDEHKVSPRKKLLDHITISDPKAAGSGDASRALKSPRNFLTKIKEDSTSGTPIEPAGTIKELETKQNTVESNFKDSYWHEIVDMDEQADNQIDHQPLGYEIPKCHQYSQTDLEDDNLTLVQWREKYENCPSNDELASVVPVIVEEQLPHDDALGSDTNAEPLTIELKPTAVEITEQKLNEMENQFLASQSVSNSDETKLPNVSVVIKIKSAEESVIAIPAERKPMHSVVATSKYSNIVSRPNPSNVVAKQASVNRPVSATGKPRLTVISATQKPCLTTQSASSSTTIRKTYPRPPPLSTGQQRPASVAQRPGSITTSGSTIIKRDVPINRRQNTSVPSNVVNRLTARSKTMIDMPNKRPPTVLPFGGGSRKVSREDVASSSSTLKASTERISSRSGSQRHLDQGGERTDAKYRRSEPKSMPAPDDNDGWLTVKAKRRSSLHWANRFNQPTGYASLPTLAMPADETSTDSNAVDSNGKQLVTKKDGKKSDNADDLSMASKPARSVVTAVRSKTTLTAVHKPKVEAKASVVSSVVAKEVAKAVAVKVVDTKPKPLPKEIDSKAIESKPLKQQRAQAPPPPKITKPSVMAKVSAPQRSNLCDAKAAATHQHKVSSVVSRDKIVQRQKSDLTGLKLTKLHKEYMRNEKNKTAAVNELQPAPAPPPPPLPAPHTTSPESTASSEFSQRNRIDMNIQTNLSGLSKAITDIYENMDEKLDYANGGSTYSASSCDDELEDKDDIESDEDQRKLLEEQERLEQQIRELEQTEIDVDTETDETDCEVILDSEENDGQLDGIDQLAFDDNDDVSLEMRYQLLLSDMSLGERIATLATLQAFVSRHPGRAQELHKKLSSPSRRRSLHETLKKYQAKQARAQEKREALQREKAHKLQVLLARVEDVKAAKQQLIDDKRLRMEERLQRASENRTQFLRDKIRKAHDEEAKMKEIAFIKSLEAQNKRLDFLDAWREQEGRLQDLEQERQKRMEEKAAKEAAVERRRFELELERLEKLEKMKKTR